MQRLLRGEELRAALADGRLKASTLVWKRGMKGWVPAIEVRELRAFIVDEDLPDTVTKQVPVNLGKKMVPTPSIPAPGIRSPGNRFGVKKNAPDDKARLAAGLRGPANTLPGVGDSGAPKDLAAKGKEGGASSMGIPGAPKLPRLDGGWRDGAARRDGDGDTVTALVVGDNDPGTVTSKRKRPKKTLSGTKKSVPPPLRRGRDKTVRKARTHSRKPPPPVRARATAPLGGAASIKRTLMPKGPSPKPSVPPPVGSSEVLSERFNRKKLGRNSPPTVGHGVNDKRSAEPAKRRAAGPAPRPGSRPGSVPALSSTVASPPPEAMGTTTPAVSPPRLPAASGAAVPTASGAAVPTASGAVVPTASGAVVPTASGAAVPTASGAAVPTAATQAPEPQRPPLETGPSPRADPALGAGQPQVTATPPGPTGSAPGRGAPAQIPSQPVAASQPGTSSPSLEPLSPASLPTELPPRPPMVAGLTLQYPVAAGVGAAALLAIVLSFVVGRVSAPAQSNLSQVVRAKTGWAVVPLFTRTRTSTTPSPRPCLMLRAPSRFAPNATPRIPVELATAPNDRIAVGFAESRTTPRGVVVDPATGTSELVFKPETPEDTESSLERIVPLVNDGEVRFGVTAQEADGLYRSVYVPAAEPFVIGFDKENVLKAETPGGASERMWSLVEGAGRADALRIAAMPSGYPLSYRQNKRGDSGHVYYAMLDQSGTIAHQALALAAPDGEVGKPNIAAGNGVVSVVFAHRQKVEGARWELRWARGAVTDPLKDAALVDIPVGGPGGDAGAPAITPLSGGRWLLMWMEGSRGAWTIRAQTYDKKYRPIGEALRVSPETGNFGQGVVGVVGEKGVIVFLLETAGSYEVWGTVLQCQ